MQLICWWNDFFSLLCFHFCFIIYVYYVMCMGVIKWTLTIGWVNDWFLGIMIFLCKFYLCSNFSTSMTFWRQWLHARHRQRKRTASWMKWPPNRQRRCANWPNRWPPAALSRQANSNIQRSTMFWDLKTLLYAKMHEGMGGWDWIEFLVSFSACFLV